MKKIYSILILVLASYGFATDIEMAKAKNMGPNTNVLSVCVFPSEEAKKGYLYLYIPLTGFEQIRLNDSANGTTRFAGCERKTKK